MSLRAIKKRENQLNLPTASASATISRQQTQQQQQTLFKKSASAQLQTPHRLSLTKNNNQNSPGSALGVLKQQRLLLGRAARSNPELHDSTPTRLLRSHSETDLQGSTTVRTSSTPTAGAHSLLNAKSEVCLQTISSHSYQQREEIEQQQQRDDNMLSGARSHRDLTQSGYAASGISASVSTLTRSRSLSGDTDDATDQGVVRIPIIGYEVMEERARFTVYKLRVENPFTNDCWLVLRRYTDFVRLNTKLKQSFPHVTLALPRKKLFGDNFNSVFLDNRVHGLQMFVNAIMAREELRRCKLTREFFCMDEPPSYSESMEECRAIFEAQEETITHLKLQIGNKNDLILNLQQKLRDALVEKEQLKEALESTNASCSHCSPANGAATFN